MAALTSVAANRLSAETATVWSEPASFGPNCLPVALSQTIAPLPVPPINRRPPGRKRQDRTLSAPVSMDCISVPAAASQKRRRPPVQPIVTTVVLSGEKERPETGSPPNFAKGFQVSVS